jgi:D-3-phosphoglycerate dehydrogenase
MARILLYEPVPQAWLDAFAEFVARKAPSGLAIEVVQPESDHIDDMLSLLPEADVLLVGLTGQRRGVVRHVFETAMRLKLLQKLGTRESGIDLDAAIEAGVPVSVLPSPAHVACAEHTMMLILALARKLLAAHGAVASRRPGQRLPEAPAEPGYALNWARLNGVGLVSGSVLGLIGMGDIGAEVAARAQAFGMDVLYTQDEHLPENEEDDWGVTWCDLDTLLAESDYISLHVALTPKTQNLIDVDALAKMKPTAAVINTARGGLVDEAMLAAAIAAGKLGGAAIDAWAEEPVPRNHPLLKLDTVIATPHIAAGTLAPEATFEAIWPNVLAALTDEDIDGLVTPPRIEALLPDESEPENNDEESTKIEHVG